MSEAICSVEGCGKLVRSRGWCEGHYGRWKRSGDLRPDVPLEPRDGSLREQRFWRNVDKAGPVPISQPRLGRCYVWTAAVNAAGYGNISRYSYGEALAHRWAYRQAFGPIPARLCVLHHCDNPPCVRATHLFLGNRTDNVVDMWTKGRHTPRRSRISDTQLAEMYHRHSEYGVTYRELAKECDMHEESVGRLIRGWLSTI